MDDAAGREAELESRWETAPCAWSPCSSRGGSRIRCRPTSTRASSISTRPARAKTDPARVSQTWLTWPSTTRRSLGCVAASRHPCGLEPAPHGRATIAPPCCASACWIATAPLATRTGTGPAPKSVRLEFLASRAARVGGSL